MILKGFKKAAAKKRIPGLVELRKPEYCGFPISRMAILVDAKNKHVIEKLQQLKIHLQISDYNFTTILCTEKPEPFENFGGIVYSLKDFDMKARITNERLQLFAAEGVDLLITFAQENNTAAHLLTAYTNAGLKVGRYPRNEALYDLILQCGDPDVFSEELLNYLKKLKKAVYE